MTSEGRSVVISLGLLVLGVGDGTKDELQAFPCSLLFT